MKTILLPIHPEWVYLIVKGKKTKEIRKLIPKCEYPIKVLMYITKAKYEWFLQSLPVDERKWWMDKAGTVIGEFTCNYYDELITTGTGFYVKGKSFGYTNRTARRSCLSFQDMGRYLGKKNGYAMDISDVKVYEHPKALSEYHVKMAMQTWCYVEG